MRPAAHDVGISQSLLRKQATSLHLTPSRDMTFSARESTKETAQANETFDNWRIDCCIRDRRRRNPNGHREVAQYRAVEHFVECDLDSCGLAHRSARPDWSRKRRQ